MSNVIDSAHRRYTPTFPKSLSHPAGEPARLDMATAAWNCRRMSAKAESSNVTGRRRQRAGEFLRKLFGVAFMLGIGVAVFPGDVSAGQPFACGAIHTIARGDTLFEIAERAYGDGWKYKLIFKANQDLLPDAGSVEIGHALLIPCLDGTGPATRQEALTPETHVEPEAPETAQAAVTEELPEPDIGILRRWFETVATHQARQYAVES